MCLSPIRIKNRSKHYTADGMQRRWLMVPCGHCAECIELKRRQWYMRNYWHCLECYDNNGFVLFDTLTYDDGHLPHLSRFLPMLKGMKDAEGNSLDFACFDKRDLDNFMKRLRINLTRDGYDVNGNLDYFYSTEYGSDDEYIDDRGRSRFATFRPHYHFLFYCRVPNLNPDKLAVSIYEAWNCGRTDCMNENGLRRGYMYIHNVFGKNYTRNDDVSLRKVSNYVAKYVTKEPEYKAKVENRVSAVTNAILNNGTCMDDVVFMLSGTDFESFSDYESAVRDYVLSYVDMFHNQSHGFGGYALKFPDNVTSIMYEGVVRMPDEERVKAEVSVPLYYVRKLYCRLVQPVDGHYSWVWNRKGKEYLRLRAERSVKFASEKYYNAFLNMKPESQSDVLGILDLEKVESDSFRGLAEYALFKRDRFIPQNKPCNMQTAVEGSLYLPLSGTNKSNLFIQDDDGDLWLYQPGVSDALGKSVCREWINTTPLCPTDYSYEDFFLDGEIPHRRREVPVSGYWKETVEEYDTGDYLYVSPDAEYLYLYRDNDFERVLGEFERYFSVPNAKKQEVFDMKERLRKQFSK